MHKFLHKIIFIICCLSVNYGFSQVLPPDFHCIKSDTLLWTPVLSNCGNFQSYNIFFSSTAEGPYSILTSVIDPNQDKFFHSNPTDLARFYYIQSQYDCPNGVSISSDTISNRAPEIPRVTNLSVIGNDVELVWEKSPDPETIGYIVYRVTNVGTVPIDTVIGDVTYLDTNADPINQIETYFILALDQCGNTSIFGEPQSTYLLNFEVVECRQEIAIDWIPTTNFQDGIASQEVWVSEEGNAPVLGGRIDGNTNSFVLDNITEGFEYCIFVRAISNGEGFQVSTNTICITAAVVQNVTELYFKNLDIQSDGSVEVEWVWNENAALNSASLNFSLLSENINQSIPLNTTSPLSNRNNVVVTETNGSARQWEYQIETTDECDTIKKSRFASPIFLTIGASDGLSNVCFWTPLKIPNAAVESYEIFRRSNSLSERVGVVDPSTFEFTDNLSIDDVEEGELCYTIRATSILTHPDGFEEEIVSSSNQICKTISARIFMPNAFAPRGINQILKPLVSFGEPQEYRMLIYNRYGALLFESDDIQTGWNGKYQQRDAPMGVYSYLINIVQQDGSVENLSGTVMLVR